MKKTFQISDKPDPQGYAVLDTHHNIIGYIVKHPEHAEPHFAPLTGIKLNQNTLSLISKYMTKKSIVFPDTETQVSGKRQSARPIMANAF